MLVKLILFTGALGVQIPTCKLDGARLKPTRNLGRFKVISTKRHLIQDRYGTIINIIFLIVKGQIIALAVVVKFGAVIALSRFC